MALDLDFHTMADQPPHLHHLAKRYLDLLGAAPPQASTGGRRHLLYRDDFQVRLLYVRVWQPLSNARHTGLPSTAVVARPVRDVVADLELATTFRDAIDDRDDDDSPFHSPDVPDVDLDPTFDLRMAADPAQAQRWSDLNMWLTVHDRSRVQESVLRISDALIAGALSRTTALINPNRISGDPIGMSNGNAETDREMLLSNGLHVPLPALPNTRGQRDRFRADLRERLQQWQQRWAALTPLLVPVKATLLVVKPQNAANSNGKDLDNLVRDDVLPAVHEVLAPHLAPWITRFPQLRLDEQATWRPQQRRLRQLQQSSVTAYEVIQLVRTPADPAAGVLQLALGSGTVPGSTWSRLATFVERHIHNLQT